MIHWLILGALICMALGFESSRKARNRRECDAEGHLWSKNGMGDDPSYQFTCTRCGLEF